MAGTSSFQNSSTTARNKRKRNTRQEKLKSLLDEHQPCIGKISNLTNICRDFSQRLESIRQLADPPSESIKSIQRVEAELRGLYDHCHSDSGERYDAKDHIYPQCSSATRTVQQAPQSLVPGLNQPSAIHAGQKDANSLSHSQSGILQPPQSLPGSIEQTQNPIIGSGQLSAPPPTQQPTNALPQPRNNTVQQNDPNQPQPYSAATGYNQHLALQHGQPAQNNAIQPQNIISQYTYSQPAQPPQILPSNSQDLHRSAPQEPVPASLAWPQDTEQGPMVDTLSDSGENDGRLFLDFFSSLDAE